MSPADFFFVPPSPKMSSRDEFRKQTLAGAETTQRFKTYKNLLCTIAPIILDLLPTSKRVSTTVFRSAKQSFIAGDVAFVEAKATQNGVLVAGYVHSKVKGSCWWRNCVFLPKDCMWDSPEARLFCTCNAFKMQRDRSGCFTDRICMHVLTTLILCHVLQNLTITAARPKWAVSYSLPSDPTNPLFNSGDLQEAVIKFDELVARMTSIQLTGVGSLKWRRPDRSHSFAIAIGEKRTQSMRKAVQSLFLGFSSQQSPVSSSETVTRSLNTTSRRKRGEKRKNSTAQEEIPSFQPADRPENVAATKRRRRRKTQQNISADVLGETNNRHPVCCNICGTKKGKRGWTNCRWCGFFSICKTCKSTHFNDILFQEHQEQCNKQ
mmetsp:Transcript_1082/g.1539  ORF Transcript_1082/g.1539 Transcript_1082/m.1539 type:complete len:378 (-) Transcript_1082:15-1148(-)